MTNYFAKLTPLHETKSIVIECLNEKKTTASKKAMLTRWIKIHVEFISEVEKAIAGNGWYLGNIYMKFHLNHYRRELTLLNDIKNSIQ